MSEEEIKDRSKQHLTGWHYEDGQKVYDFADDVIKMRESEVNSVTDWDGGGMCVWGEDADDDDSDKSSNNDTHYDLIMPPYESELPFQIFFGIIFTSMFIGAALIMITCN